MRIVILSRQESLYSTRMLVEAGRRRGHDVDVLDTLQFDIRVSRRNPELFYQGEPVGRWTPSSRASARRSPSSAWPWCASSR